MKKFLIHIFVYALPILIFAGALGAFYGVGVYSGEWGRDMDAAIEAQRRDHSILLGYAYNEQNQYYKLKNADYYQADMIALGTSRAMQFKSVYFKGGFYNCGGAVSGNYDEYLNFLQNLSYKPKAMLLDLDSWVFNDEWNKWCVAYDTFVPIQKADRKTLAMVKAMITDFMDGLWTWTDLRDSYANNIGFRGKIKDDGFMYDGSYYYGDTYRTMKSREDFDFTDTRERIAAGDSRFQYGEHIDQDTVKKLNDLLRYCEENNIYVIGYLAPFPPGIFAQMQKSGNYGYMGEITPVCEKLFKKYGFEYYDYADGAELGLTDEYFIDGFHGSEVTYAYMVRDMIEKDSKIIEYIHIDKLNALLDHAYSGLVFEEPDSRTVE